MNGRSAWLLAVALLAAPGAWCADRAESMRHGSTVSSVPLSHDDEITLHGTGVDLLHTRDSDRFRSTRARVGALVHYDSPYDLVAVGGGGTRYQQDGWSADRYTLAAAMRRLERATGAGIAGTAGVSTVGNHQKLIGEGTWNVRTSRAGGFEFIGQRDFVETRAAIEAGLMTDYLAASFDYAVTDRLTLIGLAGEQWFSDDNRRTHLRGRAIYSLLPEAGLGLVARLRTYESSRPGGAFYFNPEHYERADLGLRLRRAVGNWRVLASAGGGREEIDRNTRNPTRYLDFRAERSFAGGVTLALTAAVSQAAEGDGAGAGDYAWRYFRALVILPF